MKLLSLISSGSSQPRTNLAGKNFICFLVSTNTWIIDSGATNHMISSPKLLTSSSPSQSQRLVILPNGQQATISHTGKSKLTSSLSIDNVLYIPSFKHNLLSVSQLTKSLNCSLTFYPDSCVMQDLSTKMKIGLGKE